MLAALSLAVGACLVTTTSVASARMQPGPIDCSPDWPPYNLTAKHKAPIRPRPYKSSGVVRYVSKGATLQADGGTTNSYGNYWFHVIYPATGWIYWENVTC